MKRLIHYLLSVVLSYAAVVNAEDYTLQYEELFDTSEAQQIVRYGDVDNLGFGWPEGFNPFSGESTPRATMHTNQLKIMIDDPETGAGDRFAFDFFRLLINPRQLQNTGTMTGYVFAKDTNQLLAEAMVTANTVEVKTNTAGYYELTSVPAGLVNLRADAIGYQSETINLDLIANNTITQNFYLTKVEAYQINVNNKGNGSVASKDSSINCNLTYSGNFARS